MKKILRKLVILLAIFVLGVGGTVYFLNSETTDDRADMNEAVFPEVMVSLGETYANRMCGYAQPMQTDFMRDSITPLDTTKQLKFVVNAYDTQVEGFSYEIRTSDGSKVMENRKIKSLTEEDGYLTASVEIASDLRMNQEYSMQITLDTNKGTVYYYTRVVSRSNLNAESNVMFVQSFFEKGLDKTAAEDLTAYLEPEDDSSSTNFFEVDINSTFTEISWGSLSPTIYRRGIPVIKDINETTASVSIEYQLSAVDDDGNTEIYDVTEFYRMRYTESRIMLLDFTRSASQVFDGEQATITSDGLLLGVRDKDVEYVTNGQAGVTAFVQEGDLWAYSPGDGKMTEIFSFREDSDGDFRDARVQHDIKIIRVEDNGDVDFVLYGYMNRGIREGYCGVCVYHYSADQNVVEEKVFIPGTESYEFLQEDLGTLSYVSPDDQLFLLFAGKLYQVDIDTGEAVVLEENIAKEDFQVSDTGAHAAWYVQDGEDAGKIMEIEFDTGSRRLLTPEAEQSFILVGFMNEDLVYGVAADEDVLTDENGHTTAGISSLRIEGFDGEVKKEYRQDGYYITDITMGSTMMEFQLCVKSGNSYIAKSKDNIVNNKKAAETTTTVQLASNSRTGTQIRLSFDESPETEQPLILKAKLKNVQNSTVTLDTQVPMDEVYYVYAKGGLDGIYQDVAEAVLRADELTGVVLNRAQQYVWERGNKKTQYTMNVEDIPEAMKSGNLDKQALQEALGDSGTVLDLSGCTLDAVLYEVSAGRSVIAKTGSGTSTVIVGYDEYNTWLYDDTTGEITAYGMNDSTALFEAAGNIFISYIENV